jgi:hypothetical protein
MEAKIVLKRTRHSDKAILCLMSSSGMMKRSMATGAGDEKEEARVKGYHEWA